jgi:HD-like signal output (HDOD) protein
MVKCPFCETAAPAGRTGDPYAILAACTHCMNAYVLRYDGAAFETSPCKGQQDIRQVAKEGSIGAALLQAFPEAVESLPILPEVARRVMGMVGDPEIVIDDLAEVINQDQVIALKILQLANSALFGGLSQIKDVGAACARLGMRNVSNAVQAVANGRLYKTTVPKYFAMMHALWRHAVATAHCASELAVILAEPRSEVLFLGGLTHDIGKVLLLDTIASAEGPVIERLRQSPDLVSEAMQSYHGLMGLHVAQHWDLPPEFGITAFCHGQPDTVPHESWLTTVHIVALATALATASGYGISEEGDVSLLSHPSSKFLALNDIKLATLRVDLEDRLAPLIEAGNPPAVVDL